MPIDDEPFTRGLTTGFIDIPRANGMALFDIDAATLDAHGQAMLHYLVTEHEGTVNARLRRWLARGPRLVVSPTIAEGLAASGLIPPRVDDV